MKRLRYGPKGFEKPGLLHADGHIRDLSGLLDDIVPPEGFCGHEEGLRGRGIQPKPWPKRKRPRVSSGPPMSGAA